MTAVKKLEIIADSLELNRILEILDRSGASGYSVIKEVTGKGGRGTRLGDELTDVFKNSYVMVACSEEEARIIVEDLRPILKQFGGVCLVSDVQWIVH